jgi:hypothetical protein
LHGHRRRIYDAVQADLKGKGPGALTKGGAMLRWLAAPPQRLPIRIYYDITLLIRHGSSLGSV